MSAGVEDIIKNGLDKLIKLPTGCGEQTMIRMAPLVYVLRYLYSIKNGVTAEVEKKAYDFMRKGISIYFYITKPFVILSLVQYPIYLENKRCHIIKYEMESIVEKLGIQQPKQHELVIYILYCNILFLWHWFHCFKFIRFCRYSAPVHTVLFLCILTIELRP